MEKLLLHTCCAPCAVHPVEILQEQFKITLFFYNPNIYPVDEYYKRQDSVKEIKAKLNVDLIDAEYNPDTWNKTVEGLEDEPEGGKRCALCFYMRMKETARYARQYNFDCFGTTLTISPHKPSDLINKQGKEISREYGVEFLDRDFKKDDGFKISCQKCRDYNIYRQNYCGCKYSSR